MHGKSVQQTCYIYTNIYVCCQRIELPVAVMLEECETNQIKPKKCQKKLMTSVEWKPENISCHRAQRDNRWMYWWPAWPLYLAFYQSININLICVFLLIFFFFFQISTTNAAIRTMHRKLKRLTEHFIDNERRAFHSFSMGPTFEEKSFIVVGFAVRVVVRNSLSKDINGHHYRGTKSQKKTFIQRHNEEWKRNQF